jgi:Flp pilus assembly pilin Flp
MMTTRGRWVRDERGQTFTEYTMVLGLLTAIIIALLGVAVPLISWMAVQITRQVAMYVSSP